MYMCLARCGVGGEYIRGLGLGFTNAMRTGRVFDLCMCLDCGVVGVVVGGWAWCLRHCGVMSVCVVSLDYFCRWQV